jgi:hypothetical protein
MIAPVSVQTINTPFTLGREVTGGGGHHALNVKKLVLYGVLGAGLGMLVPVIPGGPLGGALIGAALAYFTS